MLRKEYGLNENGHILYELEPMVTLQKIKKMEPVKVYTEKYISLSTRNITDIIDNPNLNFAKNYLKECWMGNDVITSSPDVHVEIAEQQEPENKDQGK